MADDLCVRIRYGAPHSFGWLRRSEWDHACWPGYEAWESPDGMWMQAQVKLDLLGRQLAPVIQVQDIVRTPCTRNG